LINRAKGIFDKKYCPGFQLLLTVQLMLSALIINVSQQWPCIRLPPGRRRSRGDRARA
jgi:hypothetical protein